MLNQQRSESEAAAVAAASWVGRGRRSRLTRDEPEKEHA